MDASGKWPNGQYWRYSCKSNWLLKKAWLIAIVHDSGDIVVDVVLDAAEVELNESILDYAACH